MTNPQPPRSPNVLWHHATVARADRERMNGHKSVLLWFTGLSFRIPRKRSRRRI